eukprot:CAMPEP_0195072270 /NCGR_PEP_ID=MMETSP0448-20130528/15888_1 /TAXON_ID=66468 /ORGANISM="Heterocapsa triquestra, Strain CCMP 448" /LENGTH=89 /DNA_ID=CAMNT_0040104231 /DNA_START=159 /DNA_END=428 /DNA_ORIENTATION=+
MITATSARRLLALQPPASKAQFSEGWGNLQNKHALTDGLGGATELQMQPHVCSEPVRKHSSSPPSMRRLSVALSRLHGSWRAARRLGTA